MNEEAMARVGPQRHKKKNEAKTCYVFDAYVAEEGDVYERFQRAAGFLFPFFKMHICLLLTFKTNMPI